MVFYSRLFDGNMLSEFWRCSHRLAAVLKKYYEKLLDKKRWETQEECLFDVGVGATGLWLDIFLITS